MSVGDTFADAVRVIRGARTIAVCAHVDPDGDAVGSVLGLALVLERLGKTVIRMLANSDAVPGAYAFLPGADLCVSARTAADHADVFIALDAPDPARLGEATETALRARTLVVIDHHPDNRRFGHVNIVEPEAPATAEIIWRLLPMLGVPYDAQIATCLYTALMTDTGRFSYSNTTPAALRSAAAMVERGADVPDLFRRVYESRSPGMMALVGRTLSRMVFANDGRVVYSWVTPEDFVETGARPDETENLIDELRVVGGVDAVALLKPSDAEVRVSLRAKQGADVGSVARSLGGGGHTAAAGFSREGTLEAVLGELLPLLPGGV